MTTVLAKRPGRVSEVGIETRNTAKTPDRGAWSATRAGRKVRTVLMPLVAPPDHVPLLLRPALWLAKRMTGKDPLPARLLGWFPKGAFGAGVLEVTAPHGPRDLDSRLLAISRIVASVTAGCPFCLDMNAAGHVGAGLSRAEVDALIARDRDVWSAWAPRERLAAEYAVALSSTPVVLTSALKSELVAAFSAREMVVLAQTIAQVNFWSRFNQGLDVPSAGFWDDAACAMPARYAGTP